MSKCEGRLRTCQGQCERNGTISRDGRVYCWQHDPGDPEENKAKRMRKYAEEEAQDRAIEEAYKARRERQQLLELSGVDKLTNEDLQTIISHGGIQSLI